MICKYMKRHSASLAIKEMQIKNLNMTLFIVTRITENKEISDVGEDTEQMEPSGTAKGNPDSFQKVTETFIL